MKKRKSIDFLWKKFGFLALIIAYIAANLMSLVLVFRASPVVVNLGIIKRIMVFFSGISIPAVYIIFIVLVVMFARDKRILKQWLYKIIGILIIITGILVISAHFYFSLQDMVRYLNFSFSQYYIYLPSLKFYANFQMLVLVAGIMSFWASNLNDSGLNKFKGVLTVENLFSILIIALFPIILFNLISDIPMQLKDELTIYHTYIISSDKNQRPDFFELKKQTDFIKKITPDNTTIIHPTQSAAFPLIGNQPLIRHDLFPRRLVSAKFASDYVKIHPKENIYYIFMVGYNPVINSFSTYPPYSIPASEIDILYSDGREIKIAGKNYTVDLAKQLGDFEIGLIKLK